MAVFRRFLRLFCGAIFALTVAFVSSNAFSYTLTLNKNGGSGTLKVRSGYTVGGDGGTVSANSGTASATYTCTASMCVLPDNLGDLTAETGYKWYPGWQTETGATCIGSIDFSNNAQDRPADGSTLYACKISSDNTGSSTGGSTGSNTGGDDNKTCTVSTPLYQLSSPGGSTLDSSNSWNDWHGGNALTWQWGADFSDAGYCYVRGEWGCSAVETTSISDGGFIQELDGPYGNGYTAEGSNGNFNWYDWRGSHCWCRIVANDSVDNSGNPYFSSDLNSESCWFEPAARNSSIMSFTSTQECATNCESLCRNYIAKTMTTSERAALFDTIENYANGCTTSSSGSGTGTGTGYSSGNISYKFCPNKTSSGCETLSGVSPLFYRSSSSSDTTITPNGAPDKTSDGYAFNNKWSLNPSCSLLNTGSTVTISAGTNSDPLNVYACYDPYRINLNGNGATSYNHTSFIYTSPSSAYLPVSGGSIEHTRQMTIGSNGNNPVTIPTKTGYTFTGYYSAQTGGTKYIDATGHLTRDGSIAASNNTSISASALGGTSWYAQWTENSSSGYNIQYRTNYVAANGAYSNVTCPSSGCTLYTAAQASAANSAFNRSGYTLMGWDTYPAGGGTSYSLGQSVTPTADMELYAQWGVTITYLPNYTGSGSVHLDVTCLSSGCVLYNASQAISGDSAFNRSGYVLTGWNTSANGSGTSYSLGQSITPTARMSLYAQWTELQCTENSHKENGECVCDTGYTYASNGPKPDLTNLIGVTQSGDDSGYISTNGLLSINTAQYGISAPGEFVADFGDKGTVHGYAQCSTRTATDPWTGGANYAKLYELKDDGFVDTLPDSSGANCYCKLDGYTPTGSNAEMRGFSDSWLFLTNEYEHGCGRDCAGYCAESILAKTYIGNLSYRKAIFGILGGSYDASVVMCEPKTYQITYAGIDGATHTAYPTTYTVLTSATIGTPTKDGYTFVGWTITTAPTHWGTGSSQSGDKNFVIATGTYGGDIKLTAQWIENAYPFTLTTTETTDYIAFFLSASGTFYVDCGDGGTLSGTGVIDGTNMINRENNVTQKVYSCGYSSAGVHTIRFGGSANGYNTSSYYSAIKFSSNGLEETNSAKIASISGSLGAIFGTVENPTVGIGQPSFWDTFDDASNMTGTDIPDPSNPGMNYALPPTLFDGIYGTPVENMFNTTFAGCNKLTGTIPSTLFGGVSGDWAKSMFLGTFSGCSRLTGPIPAGLFRNLTGAKAKEMLSNTFNGCSGLTGKIPLNLFGNLSGAPVANMFSYTFYGCSGLDGFTDGTTTTTYVPKAFLENITTNTSLSYQVNNMFTGTSLAKPCPANTYNVTRAQFNDAGKPWCTPCPDGTTSPAGSTSINQCVAPSYTITLNKNSGTFPSGVVEPRSYTDSTLPVTLPIPTRSGYTFDGWYNNLVFAGDAITEIPTGSTGNKEFWAKWIFGTMCPFGYSLETLADLIGATTSGVEFAYIDSNGVFTEANEDIHNNETIPYYNGTPHGQSYYKITNNNTWAVNYGSDKGFIYGQARCSNYGGSAVVGRGHNYTLTNEVTKVDNFSDETGKYCWCKITGYQDKNGNINGGSSWFILDSDAGFADYCEEECSKRCAVNLWYYSDAPDFIHKIADDTNGELYRAWHQVAFDTVGVSCQPIVCPAGQYLDSDSTCKYCAKGSYSDSGATSCTPCQNGTTTTGTGQTSCNAICPNNNSLVTGWKTASWAPNTVTNLCAIDNCDTGYHVENTLKDLDPNIVGTKGYSVYLDLYQNRNIYKYCNSSGCSTTGGSIYNDLFPGDGWTGEWKSLFSYGYVYGKYKCSTEEGPDANYGGNVCWCATTKAKLNNTTEYIIMDKPVWQKVSTGPYCYSSCGARCSEYPMLQSGASGYIEQRKSAFGIDKEFLECVPNIHTITLDNRGATTSGTTTIYTKYKEGTYLDSGFANQMTSNTNPITIPTKTGYVFGGYYYNDISLTIKSDGYMDGSAASAFDDAITEDTTLYAKWTPATYTVTYKCGTGATGNPPAAGTATYNENFTPAANKTCAKTGYVFAGWNDGTTDRPAGTAFKWTYTSGKTFTAKFTCAPGYTYDPGGQINLVSTIGTDAGVSSGYVNNAKQAYDQATALGISNKNTWAVNYGAGKGILIGQAHCSTVSGNTNNNTWTNPTTHTTSELGSFGGKYCYCNVTGYKDSTNGDLQSLSSPWVIRTTNSGSSDPELNCADFCASDCSLIVYNFSESLAFRAALLGKITNSPVSAPSCTPATYTITLNDSTNGGANGMGTVKEVYSTKWTNASGTTISTVTIPTKQNAVFNGYYTAANGGDQKIPANGTLPANTTFTANTTLYAQFSCNTGYVLNSTTKACDTASGIQYKVYHYTKNAGNNNYTQNGNVDTGYGTTGTILTLTNLKRDITGYAYTSGYATQTPPTGTTTTKPSSGAVTTTTVLADGSRVISLYYDPIYTIKYMKDDSEEITGLTPTTYVSGTTTALPTNVNVADHVFSGYWYDENNNEINQITPEMYGNKVLRAKWSRVTCPAGYMLVAGECQKCNTTAHYCPGGTFVPGDPDDGERNCPELSTNNIEGAYYGGVYGSLPYISGLADVSDAPEDCVAMFYYGRESILQEPSIGSPDKFQNYDTTLLANINDAALTQMCTYNASDAAYTNCLPLYYSINLYCAAGYYIPQSDLSYLLQCSNAYSTCESQGDSCDKRALYNSMIVPYIGSPYACTLGEAGYYTATYDMAVASGLPNLDLLREMGVMMAYGYLFDPSAGTYSETTTLNDVYRSCSVDTNGAYPHSQPGSWTKKHCYATISFNSNGGNTIDDINYYYHDANAPCTSLIEYVSNNDLLSYATKQQDGNDCYAEIEGTIQNNTTDCNDAVFNDIGDGDWKMQWSYGTIKGTSLCSSTPGNRADVGNPTTESGNYCWCKITDFIDSNENSLNITNDKWVAIGTSNQCSTTCSGSCPFIVYQQQSVRNALYGQTGEVCPVEELPTPTREGYTFDGWYANSGLTGNRLENSDDLPGGDKTLYAKWISDAHNIVYNQNGGNGCTNTTYFGTTVLCEPTRTGYTFDGWATTDGGTVVYGLNSSVTNLDLTLYAIWTPATYTVTLNKNATDAVDGTKSVTATYNEAMPTPITLPTRTGYTFVGYYDTDALTGGTQYYTAVGASARTWDKATSTTLYARWSTDDYTITYVMDGGNNYVGAPTSYTFGTGTTIDGVPTRDGYIFTGWCTDEELENCAYTQTIGTNATGNKEFWAKWEPVKFTLTTTEMTANDTFKWSMSAAGVFYVDCGENGVLSGTGVSGGTINRINNTNLEQYTCTYPNAGTHTIRFGGAATGYSSNSASEYAAIGFSTQNYSDNTPAKIAGISGSLGAIFGTIGNGGTLATQPRFIYTFYYATDMTGSIPSNLFTGITGAPASFMFSGTFWGCSNLSGQIPATLFAGIHGTPAEGMFSNTFYNCSGLTGTIPSTLFCQDTNNPNANNCIYGAPAESMFYSTFRGCSNLSGQIPATLFAGIHGAPAQHMFSNTFSNCSNLSGQIPATLFVGIHGAPAQGMFSNTFLKCSGLTGTIPSTLFCQDTNNPNANNCIYGAPAKNMFMSTFMNCSGLTGFTDGMTTTSYVPGTFLNTIDTNTSVSLQALYMFTGTGLANSCPAGTYTVTRRQFNDAGKPWCSPCPSGYTSTQGENSTINQCYTTCPATDSLGGTYVSELGGHAYYGVDGDDISTCKYAYTITYNLNGGTNYDNAPTSYTYGVGATIKGTPTRDGHFFIGWCTDAELENCAYTQTIGTDATGNKEFWAKWEPVKFTLITTDLSSSNNFFYFKLSAAGTFYVDCGDGGRLSGTNVSGKTITRFDITENVYTCEWSTTGAHTIRFGGEANGYNNEANGYNNIAAIDFYNVGTGTGVNARKIEKIFGSLGHIFPTKTKPVVGQGQPSFYETFASASNMKDTDIDDPNNPGKKYAIPPTLFDGVFSAPAYDMFGGTFRSCSGLTGTIPPTLFAGINGAPASNMFGGTFQGCSGLTGSIPATLFAGIHGSPAPYMFSSTFWGCSSLTGQIPATLFCQNPNNPNSDNCIYGAPASNMFSYTFEGCGGLTGAIPATLFAGIHGEPAEYMFKNTFTNCSGLTGAIPATLFCQGHNSPNANNCIYGAPANYMFQQTFLNCTGLTGTDIPDPNYTDKNYALPPTLFAGIHGRPAKEMFSSTFYGCSGLTGTIPGTLFCQNPNNPNANNCIYDKPADNMFSGTFIGCRNLSGSIPSTLFAGISGAPANNMYASIFSGCSGLTGPIPLNLFGDISGTPASGMFYRAFYGCSGLDSFKDGDNITTYVQGNFLDGIDDNTSVTYQVGEMFVGTQLDIPCPAGTYDVTRGQFKDDAKFNNAGKPWCLPCPNGYTSIKGENNTINQCYTTCPLNDSLGGTYASELGGHAYYGADGDDVSECKYTYTITYHNGEDIVDLSPATYTYTIGATIDATLTREGWTFDGWYDNSEFTGNPITNIPTDAIGNKDLYAKWTANTYIVTFDPNGGDFGTIGTRQVEVTFDEPMPTINGPERNGYDFVGYYDTQESTDGTKYYDPDYYGADFKVRGVSAHVWDKTSGATLYAHWTPRSGEINLSHNDGTNISEKIYTIFDTGVYKDSDHTLEMTSVANPVTPLTRNGFTFDGYVENILRPTTINPGLEPGNSGNTQDFYVATPEDLALPRLINANGYITADGLALGKTIFTKRYLSEVNISALWKALWIPIEYNIQYVLCPDGSANCIANASNDDRNPTTYNTTQNVTLYDASRTGYDFAGWYDNPELSGNVIATIQQNSIGQKIFYASWTPKQYTISYRCVDNGDIVRADILRYGDSYNFVSNTGNQTICEKPGYIFTGWDCSYIDDNSGVNNITTDPVSKWYLTYNVFCEPKPWDETQFNVTFKPNSIYVENPNAILPLSCRYSTGCEIPENEYIRKGYLFDGWVSNEGIAYAAGETIKEQLSDVTMYAQWILKNDISCVPGTYLKAGDFECSNCIKGYYCPGFEEGEFAYSPTENQGIISCKKDFGSSASTVTTDSKCDDTEEIGGCAKSVADCYVPCEATYGNYVLDPEHSKVRYGENSRDVCLYKADIEYQGAENCETQTYYMTEKSSVALCVPNEVLGRTFIGWIDNKGNEYNNISENNNKRKIDDSVPESGVVTMIANWNIEKYAISYDCGNGNNIVVGDMEYDDDVELLDYARCNNPGYTLTEWNCGDNFVDNNKMPNHNVECVAETTVNTYNIEFNGNGADSGNMANVENVSYVAEQQLPENTYARSGYNFAGWCDDNACSGHVYGDKEIVSKLTPDNNATVVLYAKWEAIPYAISYTIPYGITVANKTTYTKETPTFTLNNPSKPGYKFNAWCTNAELTENCELTKTIEQGSTIGQLHFFADIELIEYKVAYKFKDTDGVVHDISDMFENRYTKRTVGQSVSYPKKADVHIPNYNFVAWYNNSNLSGASVNGVAASVTSNMTAWAKVTTLSCSANQYVEDGICKDCPVHSTSDGTLATECVCDTGYYKDGDNCISNTITLDWNENGGSQIDNGVCEYGTDLILPDAPLRDGYVFGGWKLADGTIKNATEVIAGGCVENYTGVTSDVSTAIVAQWNIQKYTIKYNSNGGTTYPQKQYTVNSADIILPKDAVRHGYEFGGWYANSELTGDPVEVVAHGSTGNKEFWALWNVINYEISYNTNGGEYESGFIPITTYNINSDTIILPTSNDIKRNNYEFAGWVDENNNIVTEIQSGSSGNKELTAQWTHESCEQNQFWNTNSDMCDACPAHSTSAGGLATQCVCDKNYVMNSNTCVPKDYTITYYYDGGALAEGLTNPQTYNIETPETTLYVPTKTDYTFNGWRLNSVSGAVITSISGDMVAYKNIKLYANWTKNPDVRKITYNCKTDKTIERSGFVGTSVSVPTTEECEIEIGEITGWTCNNQTYTESMTIPSVDLICSPIISYSNVEYNIIYKGYDTTGKEIDLSFLGPTTYVASNGIRLPTKNQINVPGYNFERWYLKYNNSVFSSSITGYAANANIKGTKTFYGKFTVTTTHCDPGYYLQANSTECVLCEGNGVYCPGGDLPYSDTPNIINSCEDEYPLSDAGAQSIDDCYKNCAEHEHYTVVGHQYSNGTNDCVYTPVTYHIYYNTNGGNVINPTEYNVEMGIITDLPIPVKNNKDFDGWFDVNETQITGIDTSLATDITLYAHWMPKPCAENQYVVGEECVACPDGMYSDGGLMTECGCKPGYEKHTTRMREIYPESGVVINSYSGSGMNWHMDLKPGTWVSDYADGFAECRYNQSGPNPGAVWNENDAVEPGKYCWCRMNSPFETKWIYSGMNNSSRCSELCANDCGARSKSNSNVKIALFGSAYSDGGADYEITTCEIITYNITYVGLEGATHTNPSTYTVENAGLQFTAPSDRVGYEFTGWTKDGEAFVSLPQGTIGDIVLTANWKAKIISCDPGYYLPENSETCERCVEENVYCPGGDYPYSDTPNGKENCPAKYPYSTDGISCYNSCVDPNVSGAIYADGRNTCDYTYQIIYHLDGGEFNTTYPETYEHGAGNMLLARPVKQGGYSFGGWYNNSEKQGNPVTVINTNRYGVVELWAKWEFLCESGKWLHFGNGDDKMCLYAERPLGPVMVFGNRTKPMYAMLSEDENVPVHKGSSKKLRISIGNKVYNAHDASVNMD